MNVRSFPDDNGLDALVMLLIVFDTGPAISMALPESVFDRLMVRYSLFIMRSVVIGGKRLICSWTVEFETRVAADRYDHDDEICRNGF